MSKVQDAETLAKVAALETALTAKAEELAKVKTGLEDRQQELAKVQGQVDALQQELDELKAEAAPAKGALREGLTAPAKEEDGLTKVAEKEPQTPLEAVRLAHTKPQFIKAY